MLNNFDELVNKLVNIIGGGVSTLLMSVAFIVFLLAVINFILRRRAGDGKGLQEAGSILWWSVFALFVMVAVWGLVNFLATNLLGADANKKDVVRPQTNFGRPANSTGNVNAPGTINPAAPAAAPNLPPGSNVPPTAI